MESYGPKQDDPELEAFLGRNLWHIRHISPLQYLNKIFRCIKQNKTIARIWLFHASTIKVKEL